MRLANLHQIGYQAWSWGHGNSNCPLMDMTLPDGDFADLTEWGGVVADDLADSTEYLISMVDQVPSEQQAGEPTETLILFLARGDVGGEQFRLVIDGTTVQNYSASSSFQLHGFLAAPGTSAADIRIEYTEDSSTLQDQNLVVDYVEVNGVRYESESSTTFFTVLRRFSNSRKRKQSSQFIGQSPRP